MKQQGRVIGAFGRQYLAELADGAELACVPRGKKSEVACGDVVELQRTSADQAVIEAILPRKSLLYRSVAHREKLIAANVTQVIAVVAAEPSFDDELLARCLVAAHSQDAKVLIVLNKCDLADQAAQARERLAPYGAIGYRVLELSAKQSAAPLRPFLQGHTSVLVGQSGMGKSTLINALLPDAQAATREISGALDSGKHTTTHARLYRLDEASALIDSPGLQEFGLAHLSFGEIEHGFAEFRPTLGRCRFHDCRHEAEPDCAVKALVAAGALARCRYEHFLAITGRR